MIHTVKGCSVVNEGDVLLEFSCFFYDTTDVGNSISGSSAFSKSSLNFWEFLVHVLLKTSLENFELYFALACKMSAIVQYFEHFLALPFFGIGMKTDLFQSCAHCWVFQICRHTECSTLTASFFRIWNGKSGPVSCGVTAPFSWVMVRTRFCCALQESISPVLWKFCNQIPLAFKVKFPVGSWSLCRIPRLGNLLWVLELLQ